MAKAQESPHGLDLVIDFVNTRDVEEGTDELATAGGLTGWLAARDLLERPAAASEGDRRRAVRLREALRGLMLENNGGPGSDGWQELERAARDGKLSVHFGAAGSLALTPGATGLAGSLGRLLVPVAHAIDDDIWHRVKACRAPDCNWAFYDRSRNRSGVWCEMAVCGNRTKVRAYRQRSPGGG
jgi:predicted RNA-binding Zn ribbon-like protein